MGKKTGVSASFGSRYGTMARKRYTAIMKTLKEKHECPSCGHPTVRRESFGIWACRKCGYTFAGGAYTPTTKVGAAATRAVGLKEAKKPAETPGKPGPVPAAEAEE